MYIVLKFHSQNSLQFDLLKNQLDINELKNETQLLQLYKLEINRIEA